MKWERGIQVGESKNNKNKGIQKLEDKKEKLRSRKFVEEEPDENCGKGNPGREKITKEKASLCKGISRETKRANPEKGNFERKNYERKESRESGFQKRKSQERESREREYPERHSPDIEMFPRKGILKSLFEEGLPEKNL